MYRSTDVVTLSLVTHLLPSGPVFRDAACLVQPSGQYLHTSTSQYIIPGPGRHLAQFDLQIRPRPAVMAPRSPLRPVENWIISYFVIIKVPDPPWPRWCWLFSHACSGSPTFTITLQTKRFTIFYDEKQETHASNITKDMRKQIVHFSCNAVLHTHTDAVSTLLRHGVKIPRHYYLLSMWPLTLFTMETEPVAQSSGCEYSGAMLSSAWMEAIRQIKATWSKYYSADPVWR